MWAVGRLTLLSRGFEADRKTAEAAPVAPDVSVPEPQIEPASEPVSSVSVEAPAVMPEIQLEPTPVVAAIAEMAPTLPFVAGLAPLSDAVVEDVAPHTARDIELAEEPAVEAAAAEPVKVVHEDPAALEAAPAAPEAACVDNIEPVTMVATSPSSERVRQTTPERSGKKASIKPIRVSEPDAVPDMEVAPPLPEPIPAIVSASSAEPVLEATLPPMPPLIAASVESAGEEAAPVQSARAEEAVVAPAPSLTPAPTPVQPDPPRAVSAPDTAINRASVAPEPLRTIAPTPMATPAPLPQPTPRVEPAKPASFLARIVSRVRRFFGSLFGR